MKYKILTLILFSSFLHLWSQAPGYMGKRMVLGYGFHFSPAFLGANAQNQTIIGNGGSAETGSLAFNVLHEGYLEYATGYRFSIGLSGRFYKTAYDNAAYINKYNDVTFSAFNDHPAGYYNITGLSICLYGKLYGKRYVAPWGRYIIFGPVINIRKTEYDPSVMYVKGFSYNSNYYSEETTLTNFGPAKQSFTGFNLLFGWGRNRMIGNRVTIDYGANFQVLSVFSALFDVVGSDLGFSEKTEINYIEKTSGVRIRGVNRFNAFVKVGFLLF